MAKQNAVYVKCGNGNEADHMNYDNCWFCAPYWIDIATCPIMHKRFGANELVRMKLKSSGYCKDCKKYYNLKDK